MDASQLPKPAPKVIEAPQLDETSGFDYRTHISDAKTNRLIRLQPYTKHAKGSEVMLERPPGSGNCYHENGQPAGRWSITVEGRETVWKKVSDKHAEVPAAPASQAEAQAQRIEALELELAAREAELEAATRPQTLGQKTGKPTA